MGQCQDNHAPDGEPCDDEVYCNGPEQCEAGACVTAGERCPGEQCAEASQTCVPPAEITCNAAATVQQPGSVVVELFLSNALGIRGYEAAIEIARTKGTGSLDVDCGGGIFVDVFRPDFVFAENTTVSAVNCGDLSLVSALQTTKTGESTVSIGSTPAYMGTYILDLSEEATVGSTFDVWILPDGTALADADQQDIAFTIGPSCVISVADCVEVDFGDVAGPDGSCGADGIVNLLDILAVLNGFAGQFADGCGLTDIDLVGNAGVCGGDGQIDLSDILAVLDAFTGRSICPDPCVLP